MYARNSRALRASHHAPPAGSVSGVSAWHQARQTLRVGFQTPSGLHHVMGPCLHQIKYEYSCLHQIKYEYSCLHQIKYEYSCLHQIKYEYLCLHQIKYEYSCLHQHRRSADGLFDTERRLWFSTHIWVESLLDQARRKIQVRRWGGRIHAGRTTQASTLPKARWRTVPVYSMPYSMRRKRITSETGN
jgi:hypothetical protein